jgi:hypothetical protein
VFRTIVRRVFFASTKPTSKLENSEPHHQQEEVHTKAPHSHQFVTSCQVIVSSEELVHNQTMAYLLPHLHSGWEVDQAILTEEDRVVVMRFGRDQDPACMVQDEVLMSIADKVKNFAVIYLVRLLIMLEN